MKTLTAADLEKERDEAAQATALAQQRLDALDSDYRRLAAEARLATGRARADAEHALVLLEQSRADAVRDLQRAKASTEDLARRAAEQLKREAEERRAGLEAQAEQWRLKRAEAAHGFDLAAEGLGQAVRDVLAADQELGALAGQLGHIPETVTAFLLMESLRWRLKESGIRHEVEWPHPVNRRPLVQLLSGPVVAVREVAEPGRTGYRSLTVHKPVPGGGRQVFEPDKTGTLRRTKEGQL